MADYSHLFPIKSNAPTTTSDGRRQATLTTGSWESENGRQWIETNSVVNPIAVSQRISNDFFRKVMQFLHMQFWIANDYVAANPDYKIGGGSNNNFVTWYIYEVVGASGKTLTLKVGKNGDPRSAQTYFAGGRESYADPLTWTSAYGSWIQPNDLVELAGNTVLSGRIRAKVVSRDFSGLSNPVADENDTFTVSLTSSVGNALTKYDPTDTTSKIIATIYREAFHPEQFPIITDPNPMFVSKHQIEIGGSGSTLELLTPNGASTRIAVPQYGLTNFEPTFRLEVKNGSVYEDRTADFLSSAYRVIVLHTGSSTYQTILYLGNTDYYGNTVTDYRLSAMRITYYYESSQSEGSSPHQTHCHNCRRDFNNTINNSNTNGTDSVSGEHWYCALRDNPEVTAANLNAFRGKQCYQLGSCKGFQEGELEHSNTSFWAYIYSAWNTVIKQKTAGFSDISNFVIERCLCPSFRWLFEDPSQLHSVHQYWASIFPQSGGFGYRAGIITNDGNKLWDWVTGAIYRYNADLNALTDWNNNQLIDDDLRGVIPRRLSTSAYGQFSTELNNTDDPGKVLRWNGRMIRQAAMIVKDQSEIGSSFYFANRTVAGLEGENRIQRFNRRSEIIIENLSRTNYDVQGTDYPVQIFSYPQTIRGHQNVRGIIRLRSDGADDFGYKRIGASGINGHVLRAETMSGGLRLHCSPGIYASSVTITAGADSYDKVTPFYASGNVGNLPDPLKPTQSHYNTLHNSVIGANHAREGDTLTFTNGPLAGIQFWIKRVIPSSGVNFSSYTSDTWIESERLSPYFDPFINDGNEHNLEITNIKVKFLSLPSPYYWYAFNTPAIFQTTERPTEQSGIGEYNNIRLLWNYVESGQLITTFTAPIHQNAIPASSDPEWTDNEHVGRYLHLADSDQYFIIISNTHDTIYLSPEYTAVSESLFNWEIVYNPNNSYIGDGLGFPSYEAFAWCFSTTAGLLNPQMIIEWKKDGAVQSPQTLTMAMPSITPSFTPDVSKIDQWVVSIDGEELEYQGSISSIVDLAQQPSYSGWKWSGAQVILHCNRCGQRANLLYKTTELQPMSGFGDGVGVPGVDDLTYLKKCDVVEIYNEQSQLTIPKVSSADFVISTGGVVKPAGSLIPYFKDHADTIWTQAVFEPYMYLYKADGIIYITQAAINALPQNFDLKFVQSNGFANRTEETPAELINNVLGLMNITDEVKTTMPSYVSETFGILGDAYFAVGKDYEVDPSTGTTWPTTIAQTLGIWNVKCPPYSVGAQTLNNTQYDPSKYLFEFVDDILYSDATIVTGYKMGCFLFPNNGVAATIQSPLKILEWGNLLKTLPDDVTILDAEIQISIPSSASFNTIKIDVVEDSTKPYYYRIDTTTASEVDGAIAPFFVGETNDGDWHLLDIPLESAQGEAGKSTIINFKTSFEKLLKVYRDSQYRRIGFYICLDNGQNDVVATALTGGPSKYGLIPALYQSFSKYSADGSNNIGKPGCPTTPYSYNVVYYYSIWVANYTADDDFGIGGIWVKYQLPDYTIEDMCIPVGNWPSLQIKE